MNNMTNHTDAVHFFSKMTASATHEVKNILSIINENAGLLDDIATMAQQNGDTPVPPERIRRSSGKIISQIKRADLVLKNLNRFSHCIDNQSASVDLAEATRFMLSLAGRLIEMSGIQTDIVSETKPCMARINPLFFYHVLWMILDIVCEHAQEEQTLSMEIKSDEKGPWIRFSIDMPDNNCFNKLSELKNGFLEKQAIELIIFEDNCTFGLFFDQNALDPSDQ